MDFFKILELIHTMTGMDTCYSENYLRKWYFSSYNTEFTNEKREQTVAFFKKLRLEHIPINGIRVLKLEDETYIIAKNVYTQTVLTGPFRIVNQSDDNKISLHTSNKPAISELSSIPIINSSTLDCHVQFIDNINYQRFNSKKYYITSLSELSLSKSLDYDINLTGELLENHEDNDLLFHYLITVNREKYTETIRSYTNSAPTHEKTSAAFPLKRFSYLVAVFNAQHKFAAQQAGVPMNIIHNISEHIGDQIITAINIHDLQIASDNITTMYINAIEKYSLLKHSKLVNRMLNIVHGNIYSKINLNKIAVLMKKDASYLSQRFKAEVKTTVSTYISQLKITEAKFLMKNTNDSITDIAYTLNYSDTSSFSKAFSRVCGVSPREYKKSLIN